MKKSFKYVLLVFIVLIIGGAATAYFMWNKPQRKVENEKGIEVTAAQLVSQYQANENEANNKYLDKAIQVTGVIAEVNTNQDNQQTITLASDDAFTGVYCTLKANAAKLTTGNKVTIKGICSGMLSDVRLREAVVMQ